MSMAHLSLWERIKKWFVLNRAVRMHKHYEAICKELDPVGIKDKQEARFFKQRFERYYRKARISMRLRLICYAIIYADFLTGIASLIPGLAEVTSFFKAIGAAFGVLLIAFAMYLTVHLNLSIELMNESLTHLIALYHKNAKRDTEKVLKEVAKTI